MELGAGRALSAKKVTGPALTAGAARYVCTQVTVVSTGAWLREEIALWWLDKGKGIFRSGRLPTEIPTLV